MSDQVETIPDNLLDLDEEIVKLTEEVAVVKAISTALDTAHDARVTRMNKNMANRNAYMGRQDYSYKIPGQSKEFIPKVGNSLEQFTAVLKRGLTQFGDWYSVKVSSDSSLTAEEVRSLMNLYLNRIPDKKNKSTTFAVRLSDAVKAGALDSLVILKVIGRRISNHGFTVSGDTVVRKDLSPWRLGIEVIRAEDYYPDSTGRGLFEIHRSERDIQDVIDLSKGSNPIYDPVAVQKLVDSLPNQERNEDEERTEEERGQNETTKPSYRRTVVIDEYWGDLLNEDGTVKHRNTLAAVANTTFLIRPPEANPFWHNESPFIVAPIIRVPHSEWHKALYDDATQINEAFNELFNLILDGGISEVWGIKQVRPDVCQNPEELTQGIPQGMQIVLKPNTPADVKAVESVFTGQIPTDAMAVLNMLERELNNATLTNELKQGSLPSKQVKATEVIEASQSHGMIMDSIVSDLEREIIDRILRLSWMNILQSADDLNSQEVEDALGKEKAAVFMEMRPADRFMMYAESVVFTADGLSATMSKARDFQKLIALMQVVSQNPIMLQAFLKRFNVDKIITQLFKQMNLNPHQFERNNDDVAGAAADIETMVKDILQVGRLTTGGQNIGNSADGGDPALSAEINQDISPTET